VSIREILDFPARKDIPFERFEGPRGDGTRRPEDASTCRGRRQYAIPSPANRYLQERIGYLLKRPVGRSSTDVRRSHASFVYQGGSWTKPRRLIAKAKWHPANFIRAVGAILDRNRRCLGNIG